MNFYIISLGFLIGFSSVNGADGDVLDLNIREIKRLALPKNIEPLIELLHGRQQLSQQTRNELLRQVCNQDNYQAMIPLLNAGARVNPEWMIDHLDAIFEPRQRGAGPEDQKNRIEYYSKIKDAIKRKL